MCDDLKNYGMKKNPNDLLCHFGVSSEGEKTQ